MNLAIREIAISTIYVTEIYSVRVLHKQQNIRAPLALFCLGVGVGGGGGGEAPAPILTIENVHDILAISTKCGHFY